MARRAAQGQPDTKDTPDEVSPVVLVFCVFGKGRARSC